MNDSGPCRKNLLLVLVGNFPTMYWDVNDMLHTYQTYVYKFTSRESYGQTRETFFLLNKNEFANYDWAL